MGNSRSESRKRQPLISRLLGGFILALIRIAATPFLALRHLLWARVPARTILELDLEEGVIEQVPENVFAALQSRKKIVVRDVVEALHSAAADRRIVALVARYGSGRIGIAHVEEIRDAVAEFRKSGKPAVIYTETFGEGTAGHAGYYLATAFDEIYLQPSGDVGLTGLMAESPFFKGMLEKTGLEPRLDNRYEYKNAKNLFTEERFTPPHREELQVLLESIFGHITEAVAEGRRMTVDQVKESVSRGPFFGSEAVEAGLVDGLAYRDEVYDVLKRRFPGARFLYHSVYLDRVGRPNRHGPTVALIYGVGVVRRGESAFSPAAGALGSVTMGSETVAQAFRSAVSDDEVQAILFRIDSRGGSYVASDAIWRETIRAREAGKPVIVSMANVAGSGGYFIAADAHKIVAQPSTITGSIGVVAGKMVTRAFWKKLGVTWDDVQVGGRATMWSSVQDYSPEDWDRLQTSLDRIYDDFTSKVAAGRKMTRDRVHEVARGRIWSGSDARKKGLVDHLGGFTTALRLAREAAGIDPAAEIRLQEFPEKKTFLGRLRRSRRRSSDDTASMLLAGSILQTLEPVIEQGRRAGLFGEIGELEMPDLPI